MLTTSWFALIALVGVTGAFVAATNTGSITDLLVNVGDNVLLECDNFNLTLNESKQYNKQSHHFWRSPFRYLWCRFNKNVNESEASSNLKSNQILRNKTCFEGDRYFIASEGSVSTVVYRCEVRFAKSEPARRHKRRDTTNQNELVKSKTFKLYVDHFGSVLKQEREEHPQEEHKYSARRVPCSAPRCKPYATVKEAWCSRIELQIRYPSNQYGYNQSTDHWGTISCNDQITGFQLWLIGYGVVKKFLPNERIIMDGLMPGKRYCFNGWAYNACGAGPVFTLEGVCAKNGDQCQVGSDEHCELDFDYSF